MSRIAVRKTYKLYIGGAFPRSESGRTYEAEGQNVALASRKDVRDAVVAARKAFPGWAAATPYNRGQVIYRIAEILDGRSMLERDRRRASPSSRRGGTAPGPGCTASRRPTPGRHRALP